MHFLRMISSTSNESIGVEYPLKLLVITGEGVGKRWWY